MTDPRTISERLRSVGLAHRRDEHTDRDGRHVVFVMETGQQLGRFDALDALERARDCRPINP